MGVFVYCFVVDFVVFVWWTKVNVESVVQVSVAP